MRYIQLQPVDQGTPRRQGQSLYHRCGMQRKTGYRTDQKAGDQGNREY